jgi:hypothetical protein
LSTATPQPREPGAANRLFGHLPLDLFRLLSGPSTRLFYADLLEHLEAEVFAWSAAVVPQAEVLNAVKEFVDRQGRGVPIEEEAGVADSGAQDGRAYLAYRRLVDTGWLVEHRDRYRRVVDFDGHARTVLQFLLDIKAGRTRSYGGEVLQILAALESARNDAQSKSENIRNAARSSRSFMNHLRSVASAMRAVEREIAATSGVSSLFRRFFEDFVAEHLVEDYKRLHTQSNPLRFRMQISEVCEQILGDALRMDELAIGYVKEGRAPDKMAARQTIEGEIGIVLKAFSTLDEHLALIQGINRRIEMRVRNTVRHMDRIAEADTDGPVAAMRALAGVRATSVPVGPLPIIRDSALIGPAQLYQNARKRIPAERKPIRRPVPDPAFLLFQDELAKYRERMLVTPDRIRAYLVRALVGRTVARAADLPLNGLDDFIVFERLPMMGGLGDDDLAREFSVVTDPTMTFSNPWISCPDFTVRRRTAESSHA